MACYKIFVQGIVQGVGFRPFVYNLACKMGLKGYVRNRSDGVEIVVDTKPKEFIEALRQNLPPLARVDAIEIEKTPCHVFDGFSILESQKSQKSALLLPDMSLCKECERDLFDPASRRYHYPLINCTHCGPRYTIIKDLPYDRKNTSMVAFIMCKECEREYNDPASRFFHAQPIGCNQCGPTLYFEDALGYEAIKRCAKALELGEVVAIKGMGGFHLVGKIETASKIRSIKRRSKKPFALMFPSIEAIKEVCEVSRQEERFITSQERPIVICKAKKVFDEVAPDIDRLGVFLPYSPIYALLFSFINEPLIVTSANLSDEPIIKDEEEVKKLCSKVLYYDREIVRSCDDSVMTIADKKPLFYRLSRGFAPRSFATSFTMKPTLAVGARQKNTIAIGFENTLIVSPHIGDIKSLQSFEYFKQVVKDLQKMYDIEFEQVVCDKHPKYETSQYARSLGIMCKELQHHKAHLYAALAEMQLTEHPLRDQKFCAFIWDGTGYGDDGNIWGGEVFVGDSRAYHFKYFKIAGGERAIKDLRWQEESLRHAFYEEVDDKVFRLALQYNAFTTSSVGRLFDAVACLSGLCKVQEYEGYSGLLMEKAYEKEIKEHYDFWLDGREIVIDFAAMFADNKEQIPTKFLNTLAKIVLFIAKKENLPVILSGGVFQNKTLIELCAKELRINNIDFFIPSLFPPNDGGISLGQIWWAKEC